ncbi:MAG: TPM domain-containing protein [Herbinix sp.]|nr:TPM domain-containing protein [Herbinix sp.]
MNPLNARRTFLIISIICLLLLMILTQHGSANAKSSGEIQHVYDEAGLLSTNTLAHLENMCVQFSQADNLDIIILTHNDSNAVDGEVYIENFIDKMQYLDSVVLLVDMHKRDVVLESYGKVQKYITTSRGNAIVDKITPYLIDGNYNDAFLQYVKSSDQYMNTVPLYFNPFIQLAAALVIGGITVAIMAYNAGGKMTVGGGTYMDPNHSGLIGRRDDYIRTQVTRIRKPQNKDGGGGGISAGGLSHTTSRGKF